MNLEEMYLHSCRWLWQLSGRLLFVSLVPAAILWDAAGHVCDRVGFRERRLDRCQLTAAITCCTLFYLLACWRMAIAAWRAAVTAQMPQLDPLLFEIRLGGPLLHLAACCLRLGFVAILVVMMMVTRLLQIGVAVLYADPVIIVLVLAGIHVARWYD